MLTFFQTICDNLPDWGPRLLSGAVTTFLLTITGFLVAFAIGLFLEYLRMRSSVLVRRAARAYLAIVRGVPILVILYLLYFVLPQVGVLLSAFNAGVLGLGLVYGAYLAEVFRAGLDALPKGQHEAGLAVGLSPLQAFCLILFPQAVRTTLPPLLITMISMLKDSSVCALIAVPELTLASRAIMSESFLPLHVFVLTGAFYFLIAWPASLFVRALERRFQRPVAARHQRSALKPRLLGRFT
ncbi:amino acid ABC transporter permease [Labrys neptuniae]